IPNQRQEHIAIRNNIGPARAWRAPNHPQAAVLTMCALDDLAAKLNMDPLEFFGKNLNLTKQRENTYREELAIAWEHGHSTRCRIVLSYLGRTRPCERLRSDHPSRWIGRHQAGYAGSGHGNT